MKRIFYCREKRRTRRIRYIVAALAVSAATGVLGALFSAAGNLSGVL